MDKCVQMLDKNHGTIGFQTARECICVLRTNRTREVEGDFCGLPMRRDEGRVVDPPLVFKKIFLGDEMRALDGYNLRSALKKKRLGTVEDRDWRAHERRWLWRIRMNGLKRWASARQKKD
ncbi:hypothetical protein TNCV_2355031 [Trichonephila clavipes]|nr:hypothetical protein TNCV_2355031 [Trichonephila clavipes]